MDSVLSGYDELLLELIFLKTEDKDGPERNMEATSQGCAGEHCFDSKLTEI